MASRILECWPKTANRPSSDDAQRGDCRWLFLCAAKCPRHAKSRRDVKVEKRKLPGFCAADDGGGQVDGIRCPVCDRIHLCSRQRWPWMARRRLYSCVVPSILARFRV